MTTLTIARFLHAGYMKYLSMLLLAAPVVEGASSLTWDVGTSTAGVQDGSGTWSAGGANWLDTTSSSNTTWPSGAAGSSVIAVFGNGTTGPTSASKTVTVSGTVQVGGLLFNPGTNTAAYAFTGGTIALADGAWISIGNGATSADGNKRLLFNSVLSGNNITIAKTVSTDTTQTLATIQLYGANTWTGTLTLLDQVNNTTDGLFVQAYATALNSLSKIVVGDRVTLAVSDTGTITVPMEIGVGTGTRGAIRFDASGTLAGSLTLRSSAAISINATNITGTISGNIGESGGSRSLTINSSGVAGTLVLSGNNTFTGGVILTIGTLKLGSAGALNTANPNLVTFGPTTASSSTKVLQLNGNSVAVAGLTLGNTGSTNNYVENNSITAASLTLEARSSYTFSGVLRDGDAGGKLSLIKTGTATQTLTGASTYTGSTTVAAGTLALNFSSTVSNIINNTANSSSLIMKGGTLSLAGGTTAANSQRFNGLTLSVGGSTISLTKSSTTPQDLLLSLGAITYSGGTVNFVLPAGEASSTNGITTSSVNDATGILGAWATVNGTDWAAVNGSGNIVAYTGYTTVTSYSSGAGAVGPIPDSASANIKIVDGGTSGSVVLADATGMTDINTLVSAATTATIVDINDNSDAQQGTLRLGQVGGIMLVDGAGALTIGTTAHNGGSLTAGGSADNAAGTLIFYNYSSTNAITVNVAITNNGTGVVNLVKNGSGTLVLANTNNTYSGGTTFNAGTVLISGDGSLGLAPIAVQAANLTFNGGTLQIAVNTVLNSNRGITLLAGGGTLSTGVATLTYGGIISGEGDLKKTGGTSSTGILTLSGANTYTGETTVSQGILVVANNLALGSADGGTTVADGAILRLSDGIVVQGETLTINGNGSNYGALNLTGGASAAATAAATWAGDILIGTANSRIGVNNYGTLTLSGVIRDGAANSVAFSSSGAGGTVVVSGANTYTGSTSIIRGTLKLGATNSLPSTTVLTVYSANSVTETTAFDLAGYNQTIAGLASVVPAGASDVVAVTNSNSATLSMLTINQSTAQIYYGRITGNLALVKTGSGTLTLANTYNTTTPTATTSTYTGKTTISGGTLALSGTGNIDGTPWIQIDSGAVFSVSGRTSGNYTLTNKTLSGTGSVTGSLIISGTSVIRPGATVGTDVVANAGAGIGTLTVNGDLTLSAGATRVVLQLGGTQSNLSGGSAASYSTAASGGLYDSIVVSGTLNLEQTGVIKVELASGYAVQWGDVFNLVDWTTLDSNTGNVSDYLDLSSVADLGNGWYFNTDLFLTDGIIYVVPEPSRAVLILLALACTTSRRRRTSSQRGGMKS
ncbi:autotransporter-associated beta strand repeat-containing protein [Verrucomicrobium sp. BvORR106]|uniref:beta strand repeat-containing protein n=1 Tax=Verrucomicrobium sp. BvORR106 TaxID=1403819 RepID=UPI0009DFB438|nr:autotransporter-associated beta strand repeat-containing protein [Verrucomicrobium sp. BvORR106]